MTWHWLVRNDSRISTTIMSQGDFGTIEEGWKASLGSQSVIIGRDAQHRAAII